MFAANHNMMYMVSFGFVEFCKWFVMCFMLGNVMKCLIGLHVLDLAYERQSVERKCKASLTKQCLVYGKVTMVWQGKKTMVMVWCGQHRNSCL